MPHAVTDFADLNGTLYYRADDDYVRRFDEALGDDDGTPIQWAWESQFNHFGSPGELKTFETLRVFQEGTALVEYRPDARDPAMLVPGFEIEGSNQLYRDVPMLAMTDSVALRMSGEGQWRLDGFAITFERTGV
jgi:hypothetical protein